MSYTALYRKFRPQSFEEVKGQDSIVTTLKNQIKSGRIGHAYLFCGTRGTGKTSVAKLFAKAVNCEDTKDVDPCNECASCVSIASGSSTNVIEIDAASNNSVDDIRDIREEVAYRPTEGKYKVYIIDEAHMLSAGAFNALLKTLEEPPEYVIFILATTESAKLPVTIVSRCQKYDFKRISIERIEARLLELLNAENIEAEEKGIRYISRLADGSMRDALSLLERCISCNSSGILTYDNVLEVLGTVDSQGFDLMIEAIMNKDVKGAISQLEAYSLMGKDMSSFALDFTRYMRNLLLAKNADDIEDILDVTTEEFERLKTRGKDLSDEALMRYIRVFSELSGVLRHSTSKRIEVEMALIRLCKPQMDNDVSALLERINELENKVNNMKFQPVKYVNESKADTEGVVKSTEAPILTKAPVEELVKVKEKWHNIISDTPNLLKGYLNGSEPLYDRSGKDQRLFIKLNSNTSREAIEKDESGNRALLINLIQEAAGGLVEVVFVSDENNDTTGAIASIPTAEELQKYFKIKIETE